MAVMVRATTGRVGDAGRVGDPEAEDDKTTAAFEWVYPLPSRASELVIIFCVSESARARSSRDKARTHSPPPFRLARNEPSLFLCLR